MLDVIDRAHAGSSVQLHK